MQIQKVTEHRFNTTNNITIPIAIIIEDSSFPQILCNLKSMIDKMSSSFNYHIIAVHNKASETNLQKVQEFAGINIQENICVDILELHLQNNTTIDNIKLLIPTIFECYKKIILLSDNILVLDDISKLYNIELENNLLAGVIDYGTLLYLSKTVPNISRKNMFINTDVLLINITDIVKSNLHQTLSSNMVNSNGIKTDNIINLIFDGKIKHLSYNNNFQLNFGGIFNQKILKFSNIDKNYAKKYKTNPFIINYNADKKPWTNKGVPMEKYFWQVAKDNPYYDMVLEKYHNSVIALEKQMKSTWDDGIQDEINYWGRELSLWKRGNEFVDNNNDELYSSLTDSDKPIMPLIKHFITKESNSVLDVGSGPVTVIGWKYDDVDADVTATDVLADEYKKLLMLNGFAPKKFSESCDGSSLNEHFKDKKFDVVYSRNALDHVYDPAQVLKNMVSLLKNKGVVICELKIDEAKSENYTGLHQWNFGHNEIGGVYISNKFSELHYIDELFHDQDDIITISTQYLKVVFNGAANYMAFVIHKNYTEPEVALNQVFLNQYAIEKNERFMENFKELEEEQRKYKVRKIIQLFKIVFPENSWRYKLLTKSYELAKSIYHSSRSV